MIEGSIEQLQSLLAQDLACADRMPCARTNQPNNIHSTVYSHDDQQTEFTRRDPWSASGQSRPIRAHHWRGSWHGDFGQMRGGRRDRFEMAYEVLTAVSHTPVLAGVNGTDPFMIRDVFLRELKELGFAGVQNFPTVGLIDGMFRANLEETGMSYQQEVEMIAAARQMDLLTTPYVFNVQEAEQMTKAGADIIVAHMGLTTSGTIGAKSTKTLDECVGQVQAICEASKSLRSDCLVLCHGGPIADPEDAAYILERCREVDGFYGASSMERLPTELAITQQVRDFMKLKR